MGELLGNDRKELRETILSAFPEPDDFKTFLDEALNQPIDQIASNDKSYSQVVYHVLRNANSQGWIADLLRKFQEAYPARSDVKELCKTLLKSLESQALVSGQPRTLDAGTWKDLFNCFNGIEADDIRKAFLEAFQRVHDRASSCDLSTAAVVQHQLENYDSPTLAVRFAECLKERLRQSCQDKDMISEVEAWASRIRRQFKVSPSPPEPLSSADNYAYLLVTLQNNGADVIVYPELHITGVENPIVGLDWGPKKCSFDKAPEYISEWIKQAEEHPAIPHLERQTVIIELFLPQKYLEENFGGDQWRLEDPLKQTSVPFEKYRPFLIRSADRLSMHLINKTLRGNDFKKRWENLQTCLDAREKFYLQHGCPKAVNDLSGTLMNCKHKSGLQLVAQLPTDQEKRRVLVWEIIEAPIPIALWVSEIQEAEISTLEGEFEKLLFDQEILPECDLTNFAVLAMRLQEYWRNARVPSQKSIKMLCDCPDRWPTWFDPAQADYDALVC